jgi:hypothetical protein
MAEQPASPTNAPPARGLRKRTPAQPVGPTNAPAAAPLPGGVTNRPLATNAPATATTGTNAATAADIRPPKPPVRIRGGWTTWLPVLLGAVVLVLAWLVWRRQRRHRRVAPPTVVIPPYRRALERLRAALDLLHDPHRFTVEVSDTLRVYLEERFHLHAPERTTEEFLAEVRAGQVLTPLQQQLMADFLTRCDLVKFARYEPGEPELRELYDAAVRLVEETEPLLNPGAAPGTPAPASPAMPPAAAASTPG